MTGSISPPPVAPKFYPKLNLLLEKGVIRTLRTGLRVAVPTRVVVRCIRDRLLKQLDHAIRESERATGLKCPSGFADKYSFDEKVFALEIELCEVEQFALRYLLIRCLNKTDIANYVPNSQLLSNIYLSLDKHITMNGGYDYSGSPENLVYLDSRSTRVQAYLDERGVTLPNVINMPVSKEDEELLERVKNRLFKFINVLKCN
jgi:hypothetical protein